MYIILEPERCDSPNDVLAVDGLALFSLAFVGCFSCNEADELGYAFLDSFLCIFRDFSVARNHFLHNATDVGDGKEPILFFVVVVVVVVTVVVVTSTCTCSSSSTAL